MWGLKYFCLLLLVWCTCVQGQGQQKGTCQRDSDCSLTLACIDNSCSDPCLAITATPCPMKGGICKVVGHRPVCSCPSGTQNINSTCTSDTSCQWNENRYENRQHYYDNNCEQKCECFNGEFICQPTSCESGLKPKGLLSKENSSCVEKTHPGGDECCVLWVCQDPCDNVSCEKNEECDRDSGECLCQSGFTRTPLGSCAASVSQNSDEINIKLLQITSNSIQVQFPDITGGNLMYIETRLFGRKDPPWENAILVEGNEIFTLTGLKPDTGYTLRWKAPDKQYPDVQASTLALETNQKPKVIMTNRTHDAVMLSFDPFSPPDYTFGYVASWRMINQSVWKMGEKETTGDTPTIVIDDLLPSTDYVAKISIYEDYTNRVLGESTEEIKFRTMPGCVYNSSSYAVGSFDVDCDSSCECLPSGVVECHDRCQGPYHKRGQFQDDPLCVERPVDDSGCCVLVLCADATDEVDSPCQDAVCGPNAECKREVLRDTDNTICVCKEGYAGDPDSDEGCSLTKEIGRQESVPENACITQNSTYQPGQTWYDGCDYKCSCNNKEILCESRCKIVTENVDESCELKPDPNDDCCQIMVCPSVGGSNNVSILQPSLPSDGCLFKNSTYAKEERWYDGCDQQCQCMGFGDVFCLPRCQPTTPELGEDCYTLPDVTDTCCNVTVCDKPKHEVPDVVKITTDSSTSASEVSDTTTTINHRASEKQPRRMNELPAEDSQLYIGKLTEMHHGVQGEVYAHNESILVVKDFSYDGEGMDVFFWAATEDTADGDGVILPYPFTGVFYESDDKNAPVLGKIEKQTIVLHIPPDLKLTDIKWLSVFSKQFKIIYGSVKLPDSTDMESETTTSLSATPIEEQKPVNGCNYKDKLYRFGEQFYDNCDSFCFCQDNGESYCSDIKCPNEFGLDVINPNCIEWNKHEDFVPIAPTCCPPVPVCLSDGSCQYKGVNFTNYDSIPEDLTGCEQRCHCEDGEVKCREACYEIPANPPSWLPCGPDQAAHIPNPDRTCCKIWGCPPPPPKVEEEVSLPSKLLGSSAEPFNSSCVSVGFDIPPSVGGMKGWYSIGYSTLAAGHQDANRWPTQKITPTNGRIPDTDDLIFNGGSEHETVLVCSLVPNFDYIFRPSIVLEDHETSPIIGEVVNTKIPLPEVEIEEDPINEIYVDMNLTASRITTDSARITWRHLAEKDEKPNIDGIQLRYQILNKTTDYPLTVVPETSPFIHRDTNYYVFENLKPDTKYEIELDLIPIFEPKTIFWSGKRTQFITQEYVDPYDFLPLLSVLNISWNSVEVGWTGIPSPDQKFVNIYRVIYHSINSDITREESSVFKISKIDSPKRLVVNGLDSDLEYQIWLEAYLTNGKIVKSNVEEFRTQTSSYSPPVPRTDEPVSSDYYQSMVAAAIIAALALLVLVVILYFYLKRHTTYKATITKPPPTSTTINGNSASYDNPAFKGFESDNNLNQTLPSNNSFELGPLNSEN